MVFRNQRFDPDKFVSELSEKLKMETRAPNIKKYRPHAKQEHFHSSTKKRKLYIGGNRSGKTTGGVTEAIWRATCTHPYRPDLNAIGPNRGRVVGVDFVNGIDKIIYPQYKQWLYPSALRGGSWETAYDKWTRTLNFSNGSTIEFMSYDQDLDKFAGTSRHWIHFDEEPPRTIWIECMARLIDTAGEYWITMTPVEGMTWIYDELYENNVNNPEGTCEVIEINTLENPFLDAQAITEFSKTIDADDVQTRIGGAFVQQGGRIYKNFDPTVGGIHVLSDPILDPATVFPERNWLWILTLDHGLKNPTAVEWLAVNEQGFIIAFDEHYQNELTISEHAHIIKKRIKEHGRFPDLLVADPSIVNRTAVTGTSIQEEYQKEGLSFTLGNNDVRAGIVRVKKYFNSHPYVVSNARPRHELFTGAQEFPMLRVSPRCDKLIWELKRYRFKTYSNKKIEYERNSYEEPNPKDDHACDALRYAIMTRPDLMANSNAIDSNKLSSIMDELDARLVNSAAWDISDPHNAVGAGWTPGAGTPSITDSGWEYDEHMGGYY